MKYFTEIGSIEELRSMFRAYCLELHPDKGGDPEAFLAMKAEYDVAIRMAAATEAGTANAENREARFSYEGERAVAEALERFLNIPGIIVEICGSWLWIAGNTFPVHERIKAEGAKYSKGKGKWYYSPYMGRGKRRGRYSMAQIRRRFGSIVVDSEAQAQPCLSAAA